jgi:PPOX class probable F420-dependent enzyme
MRAMDWTVAREFMLTGSRTAVVATIGRDGHPHAVPVWFTVDEDDIVFSTSSGSVKARNMQRDPRVALSIDEAKPPHAFVSIKGVARLADRPEDFLTWTTHVARRYVGPARALDVGRTYTEMDDLLVRVQVKSFVAFTDVVP